MASIKKAQKGAPIRKKPVVDSVESEMFPGRKIPRSQSNYENGSFAKMLEGNKPKKAVKKYESSPFSKAALDKKKREEGYKKVTDKMKKKLKAGGKVMLKRKDGSVSQKGLWDNIRANKGSGKKPTAAMLKQEKKIKAKSK